MPLNPLAPTIVVFGDSLADPNNLFDAAEGVIEENVRLSLGGPNGQASDGPVFAEYLEERAGFDNGLNYAVAGGEADGTQTIQQFIQENGLEGAIIVPPGDPGLAFDMNLGAQVDRFQADTAGQDLSNVTAFVLIGANDYAAIDFSDPFAAVLDALGTIASTVGSTLSAATDLASSGVGRVVVSTLPVPSFFVTLATQSDFLRGLAEILFDANNAALADGAQFLSDLGFDIELFDVQPITEAILEDPTGFGLIAPLSLTLEEGDPAALANFDADQVAFWDLLHPSGATHAIVGAYTAEAFDTEPVVLSDGADGWQTGATDDVILALGGDDGIDAGAGNDTILGGSGNDGLIGGAGDDLVIAGSGDDWVQAGDDADVVQAGQGDDVVLGGAGDDVLFDGLGSDTIVGGEGADTFIFVQAELIGGTTGVDNDIFLGDGGSDTLIVALAEQTADLLDGLSTDVQLDLLGITTGGIESIEFVIGRDGLSVFSNESWYESADLWGVL